MKRLKYILFGILMLSAGTFFSSPVFAQVSPPPPASSGGDLAAQGSAGPVCIALPITTNGNSQGACKRGQVEINNNAPGGAIIEYIKMILFVMNILVGGIIVLVIVLAGVQYIVSTGDPTRVKNAKGRIQGALIALILYLMMTAILNFLVPGGVL